MAVNPAFKKLFEPGQIGQMRTRNRIVMPAMGSDTGTRDGYVNQPTKDYYEERARGGVGLIIVEIACVDYPIGRAIARQLSVDDDKFIPGLRELAQVIQKHGARAALQLHHSGNSPGRAPTNLQAVAPSAIPRPGGEVPRELTKSEISDLVGRFARAAKRAKDAGFDGVEVHAAHAYLVAQFLSSAWNRRTDEYGGTLRNKARFLLEILGAIRETVGKSYPVWCRINGEESGFPDGFTFDEARDLARMLADAGVDAIDVSATGVDLTSARPYFYLPGWALPLAEGVKKVVSVPVIAVGRISPELGEKFLQDGKADFIAMGRALRADPEMPNKVASGRFDDIRPCILCGACLEVFRRGGFFLCKVNAEIGREAEYRIHPTSAKKRVLVIGGGPAGMEAARVAALRGHDVTLCEKADRLGGQLLLAAIPPYKADIAKFTDYLANQIKKLGVRIELNTQVTPAVVQGYKPDAVIIATGATPFIPPIAGVHKRNVATVEGVLTDKADIGKTVVILGGGMIGCEVAEFLAEKGREVTIVEMLESLAADMAERKTRRILLEILAGKGVAKLTETKGEEITDRGLVVLSKDGVKRTIEADTVVLACGAKSNDSLAEELKGIAPEMYPIGDCIKPRTILEAIDDGARIGRAI